MSYSQRVFRSFSLMWRKRVRGASSGRITTIFGEKLED